MTVYSDYRSLLKEEYRKKVAKNPSYSLRAFSRDIGLPQSRLSGVLNLRQGLSEKVAADIADKLNMDADLKEIFILLVKSEHARSELGRKLARAELDKKQGAPMAHNLTAAELGILTEWHNLVLLTYLGRQVGEQLNLNKMAEEMEITPESLNRALDSLTGLGLVQLDKNRKVDSVIKKIYASSEAPNAAIRSFQKQAFTRVANSLDKVDNLHRQVDTCFMLVAKNDLGKMKSEILTFLDNFILKYHSPDLKASEVYQLSIGLLPTSLKEKK